MPPQLLMTILSALSGGLGGLFQGASAASDQKKLATAAEERRKRIDTLIGNIQKSDYSGLENASSRQYTRNLNAADAAASATNMMGSGSAGVSRDRIMADAIASLAATKMQNEQAKQQQIGQLLQDPAYATPDASAYNPFLTGLLGLLGGTGAAGMNTLQTALANDVNIFGEGSMKDGATTKDVNVTPRASVAPKQAIPLPVATASVTPLKPLNPLTTQPQQRSMNPQSYDLSPLFSFLSRGK